MIFLVVLSNPVVTDDPLAVMKKIVEDLAEVSERREFKRRIELARAFVKYGYPAKHVAEASNCITHNCTHGLLQSWLAEAHSMTASCNEWWRSW